MAAAPGGPLAGRRERRGDRLVGRERAGGLVPDGAVAVRAAVPQRGRVGAVRGPALGGARAREHGRAHERVPEGGAALVELEQAGGLGALEPLERAAERRGGAEDRAQLVAVGDGRGEHRAARLGADRVEPAPERVRDPGPDGDVVVDRARPQPRRLGGELGQRERVAAGRRVQPVGGVGGDRAPGPGGEQLARGARRQALERELVEPRVVERGGHARAHRDDHDDRVGQQPPGGEQQRGGRRPVEPLGVVDEHDDGPLLGDRAEHAEGGRADQVPLRRRVVGEPERRAQRGGLRARQPLDRVQHRPQQLVQPGPRELELGVDPARAQHERAAGGRRRVLEQRRLADPGLAADHQHAAGSPAPAREELLDPRPLCLAPDEHPCTRADQEWPAMSRRSHPPKRSYLP